MVTIKFSVAGQILKLLTDLRDLQVTSDTINYFKCQFTFDSSWDGFEKRVYFKNASYNITKPAIPDDDGYCYIPWETLAHTGVIMCTVVGSAFEDGELTERITAGPIKFWLHNPGSVEQSVVNISDQATIDPLNVFTQKEETVLEPDYQLTPTPSEYEQFLARARELVTQVQSDWSEENTTAKAYIKNKPVIEYDEGLTNAEIEALLS